MHRHTADAVPYNGHSVVLWDFSPERSLRVNVGFGFGRCERPLCGNPPCDLRNNLPWDSAAAKRFPDPSVNLGPAVLTAGTGWRLCPDSTGNTNVRRKR